MRIITWNVNGLRAVLRKEAWGWVAGENAEVVCLQEIKARSDQLSPEQITEVETGYVSIWNPAEKPGYSGVLTLTNQKVENSGISVGNPDLDREGRLIEVKFEAFTLFNVYFPNGKRDQTRLDYKLEFYETLLERCDSIHKNGGQVIICGDFNTAHQEIDLKNPKQNEKFSGFLPEERALVDKYLNHGMVDAFRSLYPEREQYTWWTYRMNARQRNIGWRLDYFLVSEALMPQVQDVVIHQEAAGSDHCPVSLYIDSD